MGMKRLMSRVIGIGIVLQEGFIDEVFYMVKLISCLFQLLFNLQETPNFRFT